MFSSFVIALDLVRLRAWAALLPRSLLPESLFDPALLLRSSAALLLRSSDLTSIMDTICHVGEIFSGIAGKEVEEISRLDKGEEGSVQTVFAFIHSHPQNRAWRTQYQQVHAILPSTGTTLNSFADLDLPRAIMPILAGLSAMMHHFSAAW